MEVTCHLPIGLCAARLGHDLNDTAAGMAVLRLESAGFHLDFLHAGLIATGTQSSVGTRPDTEASESWVIDRNSIRNIGILQSTRAGNRGIVAACLDTVDGSGREVEQDSTSAWHGNMFIQWLG